MSFGSPDALLVRVAGTFGLALMGLHLWWMYEGIHSQQEMISVRVSLRRLSTLTIQFFPDRNLDSPALFWKAIKREDNPMKDSWGEEYKIEWAEVDGKRKYFWRSSGPDRRLGSHDDLVVEVPYPPGLGAGVDLSPDEMGHAPPPSTDAK